MDIVLAVVVAWTVLCVLVAVVFALICRGGQIEDANRATWFAEQNLDRSEPEDPERAVGATRDSSGRCRSSRPCSRRQSLSPGLRAVEPERVSPLPLPSSECDRVERLEFRRIRPVPGWRVAGPAGRGPLRRRCCAGGWRRASRG